MPITLTTTVGGSDANSYLSLAAMDALIVIRPFSTVWTAIANDETEKQYLIAAAKLMNDLNWLGSRVTSTQSLALPRLNLPKADGIHWECSRDVYDSDEIPAPVLEAQAEIAIEIARGGQYGALSGNASSSDVSSFRLGDLSMNFQGAQSVASVMQLPKVRQLLRGLVTGAQRVL